MQKTNQYRLRGPSKLEKMLTILKLFHCNLIYLVNFINSNQNITFTNSKKIELIHRKPSQTSGNLGPQIE